MLKNKPRGAIGVPLCCLLSSERATIVMRGTYYHQSGDSVCTLTRLDVRRIIDIGGPINVAGIGDIARIVKAMIIVDTIGK